MEVRGEHRLRLERVFVGPAHPIADAIARSFLDRVVPSDGGGGTPVLDASSWLVVAPGARAQRLLLRSMLVEARRRGAALDVPRFTTPGELVGTMLGAADGEERAVATTLERALAWSVALREAGPDATAALIGSGLGTAPAWMRLARRIVRLEDELAASDRDFEQAAAAVERLGADPTRLATLAALAPHAAARLDAAGLVPPHLDRARRVASGPVVHRAIALAATFELGAPQRAALRRADRILALVPADESLGAEFDALGCPLAAWADRELALDESSIQMAETPSDQAEAALRIVAERSRRFQPLACDEVAIGLADEELGPTLVRAGHEAGIELHEAGGEPLLATRVGRCLLGLRRWMAGRRPEEFASLLRQSVVFEHVRRGLESLGSDADPVAALDEYRMAHLPARLPNSTQAATDDAAARTVAAAVAAIEALLAPLADAARLGVEAVAGLLAALPWEASDAEALAVVRRSLEALAAVPHDLAGEEGVGGDRIFELLLEEAASLAVPAEPRERAVELLGWLELLFEPASHLVVVGMNEGRVPAERSRDSLLPDSVRTKLGMPSRRERVARDAAILDCLSRRGGTLALVAGRVDAAGDPLIPSRLLLALRGQQLAGRVQRLSDAGSALRGPSWWRQPTAATSRFAVPAPPPSLRDLPSMAVTSFRAFLACPVRFWLERVERIAEVADDARELSLPDLGILVHRVMEWGFASGLFAEATDAATLAEALDRRFGREVAETYGRHPLPAVRLQAEVFRRRLEPFARWQATHRAAGWETRFVERLLPEAANIVPASGKAMRLTGKVDRIDFHPGRRTWRIIDYKTTDSGKSPQEAHRVGVQNPTWIDLQLPLYHHGFAEVLRRAEPDSALELGYVRLPSDDALSGWVDAGFSPSDLDSGLDKAREIVGQIRSGSFPLGDPIGEDDPSALILQRPVFGGGPRDGEEVME